MASQGEALGGRRIVRFGLFELNLATGELRKQGIRIRLQPQPLQLLTALLENPGAIVTREELQTKLWHADTFVDFQSGLNTAVNRLRLALGDSAENPRYVETLSRSGYRFIAAVTSDTAEAAGGAPAAAERPEGLVPPATPQRSRNLWWSAVFSGAVLIAVSAGLLRPLGTPAPVRFRQITFRHGQVSGAHFAPGGQSILYVAQWERDPRQLFVASPGNPVSRA